MRRDIYSSFIIQRALAAILYSRMSRVLSAPQGIRIKRQMDDVDANQVQEEKKCDGNAGDWS